MRLVGIAVIAVLGLAGCGGQEDEPQAGSSGSVSVPATSAPATPQPSVPAEPTAPIPTTAAPTTPKPKPTPTGPGDLSFCDYLERTADAQQQVEDPAQFVALVEGARAVAPGAIADDLALYAQSVRKLALTITAPPDAAAKADQWLARNEAAVQQAEANLNSYSESTCGRPFITGEQ